MESNLIRTQRRAGKADRRNYSGEHRSHGPHFLALTDENGRLIWISSTRPGRTHDNTAARNDHILAHLRTAGFGALADLGFRGLDNDLRDPVIVTGHTASRTHKLTPGQKTAHRALAVGRAPGRAQLHSPQELADPHQTPNRSRPRHPAPARSARPDEHRIPLTTLRQDLVHQLGRHPPRDQPQPHSLRYPTPRMRTSHNAATLSPSLRTL
ncbi:transposase family protein [Streptomyces sp. A5-4]|uniref:transposase family protein n=1 Tax=Streptomyces sp. A5-4 TaxID=3384771 RepID=UPI003DA9B5A0